MEPVQITSKTSWRAPTTLADRLRNAPTLIIAVTVATLLIIATALFFLLAPQKPGAQGQDWDTYNRKNANAHALAVFSKDKFVSVTGTITNPTAAKIDVVLSADRQFGRGIVTIGDIDFSVVKEGDLLFADNTTGGVDAFLGTTSPLTQGWISAAYDSPLANVFPTPQDLQVNLDGATIDDGRVVGKSGDILIPLNGATVSMKTSDGATLTWEAIAVSTYTLEHPDPLGHIDSDGNFIPPLPSVDVPPEEVPPPPPAEPEPAAP